MTKKPPLPPRHRAYPRAHPIPVRPTAAAPPKPITSWTRTVPDGRTFPRT